MSDDEKKELIKKLSVSRENIYLLLNMIKKEQLNVELELKFATEAKQYIDEILFELTGDKFYKKTDE
jgi:hypothetical protein